MNTLHITTPKGGTAKYFKRRVPTHLVPIIGRPFWRISLKTSDLKTAEARAVQHIARTDREIEAAELEHHRRQHLLEALTPAERRTLDNAGGVEALSRQVANAPRSFVFADEAVRMVSDLANLPLPNLARDGLDLSTLEAEIAEAEAIARNLREQFDRDRITLARAKGEKPPAPPEPAANPIDNANLTTVLERWAKDVAAPAQHVEQYRYAVRRFHEVNGTLALKGITKEHLWEFEAKLRRLPVATRDGFRSLPIDAAITKADAIDAAAAKAHTAKDEPAPVLERVGQRTVEKHVTALSTLLNRAVAWDWLPLNPAAGYRPTKPRLPKYQQKADKKPGFTPAKMRALDASLAAAHNTTDDDRWIPIVAAYQGGMRIEEVCQLLKTDVKQVDGLWTIQITDEGADKKVKNVSSVRTIPLHPALIERGFLDHVQRSPGPRLFASLHADSRGRYSGPYGKRFARHLRMKSGIHEVGLSFHSLRHAWVTAARSARVPLEERMAIMGHQGDDDSPTKRNKTHDEYGEVAALGVLLESLSRVDPFADV